MRRMIRSAALGLGMLLAFAAAAQPARTFAPAAADPMQLEKRIAEVGMLLEKSSAAKQIDASADPQAREKRAQSLEAYRQAKQAYAAKDYAATAKLLMQASLLAMHAARLSDANATQENHRAEYDAKKQSVKALLAAQERISAEKGRTAEAAQAVQSAQAMLAQADERAQAGRMQEAQAQLDRAYLLVKASVSSLRSGDRLTRSLDFANKEEEYRYELDRNNTHQMLVKLLLPEHRGNAATEQSVKTAVDKAGALRGEAERAAQAGDFDAAIKQLDAATRELVRGIRALGIYIPG